jgi:hypothetical protein
MSPNDDDPLDNKSLMLFFPEGAIAILAVITAPVWAILLAQRGHILAGIIWWVGAWSFGYVAYWSYRKGDRGGIFVAIIGIAGLVLAINKWAR